MATELFLRMKAEGYFSEGGAGPCPPELLARIDTTKMEYDPRVDKSGLGIALKNGRYIIFDRFGFLCSTASVEALVILLHAEEMSGARRLLLAELPGMAFFSRPPITNADYAEVEARFMADPTPAEALPTEAQLRARKLAAAMNERRGNGIPDNVGVLKPPAETYEGEGIKLDPGLLGEDS